jgi:hypothetical protein
MVDVASTISVPGAATARAAAAIFSVMERVVLGLTRWMRNGKARRWKKPEPF